MDVRGYVFLESFLLLGDLAPNLASLGLLTVALLLSIRRWVDYLGEFISCTSYCLDEYFYLIISVKQAANYILNIIMTI